jgi:glycosyltransferase involved in cell wall biosynthesis
VLQEAGYQKMAIVSTRSAAIGEFVADGENGLMADPAAPDQLAAALERLARDPDLRARFGARANEIVRTRFSYEAGVDWIAGALVQPRATPLAPQIETQVEAPGARAAE